MTDGVNLSRRGLFRGRLSAPKAGIQLPWSVSWDEFVAGCTRCGDCLAACPEQILIKGDGGFPTVDFHRGECTFCTECVSACQAPVFRPTIQTPWEYVAHIEAGCLATAQVFCQRCQDSCEQQAIRFSPRLGRVPTPGIHAESCNGCGACVADCPVGSISIGLSRGEASR
ncbi:MULTISPECIES: ferredoxin-type protein NapF [Aeromonas]|jgi:ferredoxin-type protein NapF|uniref:Ferredoxin-type protein NapF n=1 Tax=Aeromonas caviae TaxID=648 RepID=A0ABU5W5J0_AERCA|nr:ferredoxin-type protein NapF [Aeromonas caviae]MBL0439224.1 ferredoxin-type protein NapF [Aeromonas caviae]MBL0552558.1 ferredoxin-type protein NapF [Aeromonas caviae]MBL0558961.1 ferredoxin-type protein NapF [Aeromonas caviae]MBL0649534.1 ferredoxin-type protein NapF [Aeromonas caviae]MCR3930559.1 ferredoxin-type protein NapF [Aeromonas caviae]